MKNKKLSFKILIVTVILTAGFLLSACADANGLHNQTAAEVTFVFKNFASISGDYTIPGNFNDWDNSESLVTMEDGNGTSKPITISKTNIEFSLIQTGDSGWLRPWYTAGVLEGNGVDRGTAGNPYQNFYIDGLDLNAGEITLVMDGSNITVTPEVE
ncbi:MAG: hypothetical protein K5829_02765 [Treponema sp.]|nr:hypothetical protein [Treponema sp.]